MDSDQAVEPLRETVDEYIRSFVAKKVDAIFAEQTSFSAYKVGDWTDYIVEIIGQLRVLSAFDAGYVIVRRDDLEEVLSGMPNEEIWGLLRAAGEGAGDGE